MIKIISNQTFDEERSLYNIKDTEVLNCKFEGPADGESVLKECRNFSVNKCSFSLRYPMWHAKKFLLKNSSMDEKTRAPLWYCRNGEITDCDIQGIKCLRECKNIVVENSVVKGEYLGWFSENLTFINCRIIGTQPLCYCKNLKLINCTMENTDLSFEYSDVEADIKGHIDSVKNPKSGTIVADSVGEIILEDAIMKCRGQVLLREEKMTA